MAMRRMYTIFHPMRIAASTTDAFDEAIAGDTTKQE
jgi:hypothetical protein